MHGVHPVTTRGTVRVSPTLVGVLAAVPVVGTLAATRPGPGLTADSTIYLSTGLNLATGDGLRTHGGEALTAFPPGLPGVVAAADTLGLDPESVVRLTNALAFSACVILGAVLLNRHVRSAGVRVVALVTLAFSAALLSISRMVWTEPLFVVAALLFILVLEDVQARMRWRLILLAAALVWVAFSLRYAAVALIPIGAVAIAAGQWHRNRTVAWRAATAFTVIAAVAPAAWMLRNRGVDGTLLGQRPAAVDGPIVIVERVFSTVTRWLVPQPVPRALAAVAGLAVLATFAVVAIRAVRAHRNGRLDPERCRTLVPLLTFTCIYVGYLTFAQWTTAFDPIGNRLLSPAYVPVLVLTAVVADWILAAATTGAHDRVRRGATAGTARHAVVAAAALFMGMQVVTFAHEVRRSDELGFAAERWQESPLVAAAAALDDEAVLYSNESDALWASTRREPVRLSPERRAYRSDQEVEFSEQFLRDVECDQTYLVWFGDDDEKDQLWPVEALARVVNLTESVTTVDGTIYRARPSAASARVATAC
jgi:hypothetical protein